MLFYAEGNNNSNNNNTISNNVALITLIAYGAECGNTLSSDDDKTPIWTLTFVCAATMAKMQTVMIAWQ